MMTILQNSLKETKKIQKSISKLQPFTTPNLFIVKDHNPFYVVLAKIVCGRRVWWCPNYLTHVERLK